MLRFFRRLRREFLDGHKIRSYLAYSVGEVILVVIGILIAIGINDHFNYKKDRRAEEQILNRIIDERWGR